MSPERETERQETSMRELRGGRTRRALRAARRQRECSPSARRGSQRAEARTRNGSGDQGEFSGTGERLRPAVSSSSVHEPKAECRGARQHLGALQSSCRKPKAKRTILKAAREKRRVAEDRQDRRLTSQQKQQQLGGGGWGCVWPTEHSVFFRSHGRARSLAYNVRAECSLPADRK